MGGRGGKIILSKCTQLIVSSLAFSIQTSHADVQSVTWTQTEAALPPPPLPMIQCAFQDLRLPQLDLSTYTVVCQLRSA